MTGKTPKDVPESHEDAADVDAVETQDATAEEVETPGEDTAKPVRRKRRVRVIEVLDDEDLDEVLDAMDAEDEAEEAGEPKAAKAKSAPPKAAKAAAMAKEDDEVEEDDVPAPLAAERSRPRIKPAATPAGRAAAVSLDKGEGRTFLGMGSTAAIVVIILIALLATLAIWQWRTASGLSSEADERAAVSKVASEYGDVALNYNASNYQEQMKKAQGLMGGDLLESFKASTLPSLGNTFKQNPELVLTSKTNQVFVGDIDDRFAAATIAVDVSVKTAQGTHDAPATLIRLAIAKTDGAWKVTKMYASGANDKTPANNAIPNVPTSPSPSEKPKAKETEKP
ncbi:hypothetical protein [Actinomadura sp. 9N407]|uniref:hypothetical protein n=1 Tax=Actinomadura sp. 9N407 TaxID=3375154 RepID=UPI0037B29B0C